MVAHSTSPSPPEKPPEPEPRWPAILSALATALLQFALPPHLRVGPAWLLLATVCVFLAPMAATHRARSLHLHHALAFTMLALITAALAGSLGLLIWRLPSRGETPLQLLQAAAGLWLGNVLTFASWYWHLDAGGPYARESRHAHTQGAFLFPPMAMDAKLLEATGLRRWRPGFVDYVFLSFNTSTAFSPTDTPVLSRWAKALTMIQAAISLCTLAVLATRAINVL